MKRPVFIVQQTERYSQSPPPPLSCALSVCVNLCMSVPFVCVSCLCVSSCVLLSCLFMY
uniref:Uncharacterized protein n=1 Tax=Picea sitchensis TaxID=3332 RepID=D5ACB7_PICSI|nr:unknown [Picea sitchensis]